MRNSPPGRPIVSNSASDGSRGSRLDTGGNLPCATSASKIGVSSSAATAVRGSIDAQARTAAAKTPSLTVRERVARVASRVRAFLNAPTLTRRRASPSGTLSRGAGEGFCATFIPIFTASSARDREASLAHDRSDQHRGGFDKMPWFDLDQLDRPARLAPERLRPGGRVGGPALHQLMEVEAVVGVGSRH